MTTTVERPASPAGSAGIPSAALRGQARNAGAPGSLGRNRIAAKALTRVVAAVTAEALGVSPGSVKVSLGDSAGLLVLTVAAPVRVVALSRIEQDASAVIRSGGPILDRVASAQTRIRSRVTELTGAAIGRVVVQITGIDITREERVA